MTTKEGTIVASGSIVTIREKKISDLENDYNWRRDPELAAFDASSPIRSSFVSYKKMINIFFKPIVKLIPSLGSWFDGRGINVMTIPFLRNNFGGKLFSKLSGSIVDYWENTKHEKRFIEAIEKAISS